MVALLKQKSKIQIQHKQRVKYEIASIFKRQKVDANMTAENKKQVTNKLGFSSEGKTAGKTTPIIQEVYDENKAQ